MTRDEILNMPAGQSMNELIAEKFGLPVLNYGTNGHNSMIVLNSLSAEWDYAMVNNQNFRDYPNMHFGCRMQALDKSKHIKTVFALGETQSLANCRAALLTTLEEQ